MKTKNNPINHKAEATPQANRQTNQKPRTNKPLIGIIPDFNPGAENAYSQRPHYAIRTNHTEILSKYDAIPLILTYDYNAIDNYINLIDGLLVIGGFFDIDPLRYGEKELHPATLLNKTRENFEAKLTEKFLATKKPILGICNGMQAINTIRGGKLIQDIHDENKGYMIHEQNKVKGKEHPGIPYHDIEIEQNSTLHKIVGEKTIKINSSHHQAIRTVGSNLKISAKANDGIIEAIEDPTHPFCIGVQWHPEYRTHPADDKIHAAFVKAC